jgi:hypothetical protein
VASKAGERSSAIQIDGGAKNELMRCAQQRRMFSGVGLPVITLVAPT